MRVILFLKIFFIWGTAICFGDYNQNEMFVISWGNEPDEFIAYEAHDVDPGTPEDTADDYYDGGSGPMEAFVDNQENVIVISPWAHQLKGYSNDGIMIFDLSADSPDFRKGMYRGDINNIFVDGEKQIYLSTIWPMSYVPVIDYVNLTVDSLSPFMENPEEPVNFINWTFDGKIMFGSFDAGWATYDGVEFMPGGSSEVISADGLYHIAHFTPPDRAKFYTFENPDTSGFGPATDSIYVELGVEDLVHLELLNSMEPSHLYLIVYYYTDFSFFEIWQFDLEYNLIDKVIPPAEPQYYTSAPKPFITANGDIYEFRTREDGLHVIKWSKD